jgi:hypothetical protein
VCAVACRSDGLAQQFLTNLAKLKAAKDCVLGLAATSSLWYLTADDANPCFLASTAAAVLLDQLLQVRCIGHRALLQALLAVVHTRWHLLLPLLYEAAVPRSWPNTAKRLMMRSHCRLCEFMVISTPSSHMPTWRFCLLCCCVVLQVDFTFEEVAAKGAAGSKLCRLVRVRPLATLLSSTGVTTSRGLLLVTLVSCHLKAY